MTKKATGTRTDVAPSPAERRLLLRIADGRPLGKTILRLAVERARQLDKKKRGRSA